MVGAVAAGSAALYASGAGFSTGPDSGNIDAVSILIVAFSLVGILFYGLKHYPQKSARVIVAGVTIAGTMSGLILLKVSLQALHVSPALFLLTLPLGYLGLNWSFRGYFGVLSARKTNGLMIISATLLGALIGTSLPIIFAVSFLAVLTVLDVLVVESNTVSSVAGNAGYDEVLSVVTLPLERYIVGLGDFLAYSILASAALHVLGLLGAFATILFMVTGAGVMFEITKTRHKAPGLLLPIGLGLIPLILAFRGL